jgi:two-component system sensor histidine kinase GlrK
LLSLTLVGLGLVTLPLLLAVANAVIKLDNLITTSEEVVTASRDSTLENQLIRTALQDMERYGRQYSVLRGAEQYKLYHDAAQSLANSIKAVRAQPRPEDTNDDLAVLERSAAKVTGLIETAAGLPANVSTTSTEAEIITDTGVMRAAATELSNRMRDMIAERQAALQGEARAAQETLAWQAAALIPGTLLLVLFFLLLVGRPLRQIDRAIRGLGRGDFNHSIAVSGPADIETLGRQLEWLRLRLAESSEEKNRFLRHMSHELKTPLANIREGTELLLDGSVGTLDRQQEEVAGILRENSLKLQRLIENLLTFSAWQAKTASLEISLFELKPLVFGVLSQHRLVIANRGIKLKLQIAPISVQADEGKLRLVLENLVSNAIKFAPETGEIAIRAEMEDTDLVIEVADSGPGVAPEDRGRIFEAFYQGRRPQDGPVGGTGIGLSVVHECVQAHGGEIELLTASPFSGAHFVVRLPLRRASDRTRLVANA